MSKVFNISFLHAKGKNQIRDGLMYRKKKLNKNQGMLFHTGLKVSSFWMKNTFIPLDVLFLNKGGKILGYKENNKPHSLKGISIGKKSFYVLEMNGGWVRENKVKVGDKIKIRNSRTRKKRGGGVRRRRKTRKMRGGQGEERRKKKRKRAKEDSSGSCGSNRKKKISTAPQVNEANRCGICLKGLRITRTDDAVIHCPTCNGIFCRDCLSQWIQFSLPEVAKCPLCNSLLPEETYTTLGLTHPNQVTVVVPIAEIPPITALNVTVLNDIPNPTMETGNQGEREVLHMLRGMLQEIDYNQSPLVARHELMGAIRYIRWRAGHISGYLGGNYNETNNQTPFLQALNTDYENLGGENEYERLNVITQLDSLGLDPHIQQDELVLYTQNRELIEEATTVQGILNVINNTITQYEAGPGQNRSDTTIFYRTLLDDQAIVEVVALMHDNT